MVRQGFWGKLVAAAAVAVLAGGGCHSLPNGHKCCKPPKFDPCCLPELPVPRELNKVSLPPYVIETPDILIIEATRLIPLPPYKVEPLDMLYISGRGVSESDPINGLYPVDPDGTVNLGPNYGGPVRVTDMTTVQIQEAITKQVKEKGRFNDAAITVSLAQSRGAQQVSGQHIVRPDGTVGLGSYGSVYVAGMTIAQAKKAVEDHLGRYLYRPEVNIDVYAFNSKFYYVITDFAGAGEQVVRLPHTGNETVLDAVSNVGGLSAVSSRKLWVARPAPTDCAADQILPIDWCGITQRGQVKTNYQLLPGDRVYILSQPLTKFDTYLARVYSPIQRTLGVALYGASTYRSFATLNNLNNGNGNSGVQTFLPIVP